MKKKSDFIPNSEVPIQIYMDERERGEIREIFQNSNCDLQIRTLEYGDYIISSRIIIERKRGDDFVSSIFDLRLFKQIHQMKQHFICPIILLESPNKLFDRKFIQESSIYGALMYIAYKLQISVIPTRDAKETLNFILALAEREQSAGFLPLEPEKLDETVESEELTREDQIYFLEGLVDVGNKKAKKFLEMFSTPYLFLQILNQTKFEYTKSGNIKNFDGLITNVKGIGNKLIQRNQRLLTTNYLQNKKNKEKYRP